jgi:hypothetical protein
MLSIRTDRNCRKLCGDHVYVDRSDQVKLQTLKG